MASLESEQDLLKDEFLKISKENKGDVKEVSKCIDTLLSSWKTKSIRLAITGESGSGKSSFINAMRGLNGDDPGAALVGVVETTRTPTPYKHPKNEQLEFWDLPGVGTPNFPRIHYLQKVRFDTYDAFLICSCTRFTALDSWLAEEVKRQGKPCIFVRTHIDGDVDNATEDERGRDPQEVEQNVIATIRQYCSHHLGNTTGIKIFLISNFHADKWDFERLLEEILESLCREKRDAFLFSLSALSIGVIKKKRAKLQRYSWLAATASAGVAAAPVPGLSIAVDTGILFSYLVFYRNQFGLDESTLLDIAKECKKTPAQIKSIAKVASKIVVELIVSLVKKYAVSEAAEEVARYIPIVGTVVASAISFGTTYAMLNDILNDLEKEAIAVLQLSAEARR